MKKLEVLFKFAQIRTDALDPLQPSNQARPIISFLKHHLQHFFASSQISYLIHNGCISQNRQCRPPLSQGLCACHSPLQRIKMLLRWQLKGTTWLSFEAQLINDTNHTV